MIDDLRITLPCLFVPCTKHEHFVSCGERKRCPPKIAEGRINVKFTQ